MKTSHQWIFGILAAVFLGICIMLSGGIYTTAHYGAILYKTNRFTGESEFIVGNTSTKVKGKIERTAPPTTIATGSYLSSGKVLFEEKCGVCHGIDRATARKETLVEWLRIVKEMAKKKEDWITGNEMIEIVELLYSENGRGK